VDGWEATNPNHRVFRLNKLPRHPNQHEANHHVRVATEPSGIRSQRCLQSRLHSGDNLIAGRWPLILVPEAVPRSSRLYRDERVLGRVALANAPALAGRADIHRGLSDVAQGRLADFAAGRIVARGRKLLADRSTPPHRNRGSGISDAGMAWVCDLPLTIGL
jgi:hypothetical protein